MNQIFGSRTLAATAGMKGDVRRHLPVLFIWICAESSIPRSQCELEKFKVLRAPDETTAVGASELLRARGWKDHRIPEKLQGFCLSLVPSPDDTDGANSSAIQSLHVHEPKSLMSEDVGLFFGSMSAMHKFPSPNTRAIGILKGMAARQTQRPYGDSADTQEYLREARSGGIIGDGNGKNNK